MKNEKYNIILNPKTRKGTESSINTQSPIEASKGKSLKFKDLVKKLEEEGVEKYNIKKLKESFISGIAGSHKSCQQNLLKSLINDGFIKIKALVESRYHLKRQ